MNWIQVLLILSIVALLVYLLGLAHQPGQRRRGSRSAACVRGRSDVCDPATGRHHRRRELAWGGPRCDLIEYVLIIAFVFTTLSTYMRFKDLSCDMRGWQER